MELSTTYKWADCVLCLAIEYNQDIIDRGPLILSHWRIPVMWVHRYCTPRNKVPALIDRPAIVAIAATRSLATATSKIRNRGMQKNMDR